MFAQIVKILGVVALIVTIMAILTALVPDKFWGPTNWENLLRRTALFGILGIGVAFVIMTSGIDLSVGAMVCLAASLFAVFLNVTYRPFDELAIHRIVATEQTITLAENSSDFKAGDKIRFYGGRRAQNGLYTIANVGTNNDDQGRLVTELTVDGDLQKDDRLGWVCHVHELQGFASEETLTADGEKQIHSRLKIRGEFTDLRPRDQIILFNEEVVETKDAIGNVERTLNTKIRTEPIIESRYVDDTTEILVNELADLQGTWFAVIMERRQRMPILLGLALVLIIAVGLGIVHGLLITKLHLQPFIVTLCGFLMYRGFARWLLNDQPHGFSEYQSQIGFLGSGKLTLYESANGAVSFGIPNPFFFLVMIAVIAAIFLNWSIWGRYILALGKNEEAARYSGIQTDRLTIVAYCICTLLAAIGGILFALDGNSVGPASFGGYFELYAIAAAVLGGCSLRGGEGSILGVIIGTFLMQLLYNFLSLLGISDTLEFAVIGAVILTAVVFDEVLRIFSRRWRT